MRPKWLRNKVSVVILSRLNTHAVTELAGYLRMFESNQVGKKLVELFADKSKEITAYIQA